MVGLRIRPGDNLDAAATNRPRHGGDHVTERHGHAAAEVDGRLGRGIGESEKGDGNIVDVGQITSSPEGAEHRQPAAAARLAHPLGKRHVGSLTGPDDRERTDHRHQTAGASSLGTRPFDVDLRLGIAAEGFQQIILPARSTSKAAPVHR